MYSGIKCAESHVSNSVFWSGISLMSDLQNRDSFAKVIHDGLGGSQSSIRFWQSSYGFTQSSFIFFTQSSLIFYTVQFYFSLHCIYRCRTKECVRRKKNRWRKGRDHFSSSSLPQFLHQEIKKKKTIVLIKVFQKTGKGIFGKDFKVTSWRRILLESFGFVTCKSLNLTVM